ncbi:uncharacterized protein LOC144628252 [Oculina patagonica]
MLRFLCVLSLSFIVLIQTKKAKQVSSDKIPDCMFDGAYPNDTVFCTDYVANYPQCTNARECCQIPSVPDPGCFNMSVIQAYGLWKPPTSAPTHPPKASPSCSPVGFVFTQQNNTDRALDGHVIVRHKAVTVTQCGDFCFRQPRCRAFNLATVIDPEGKKDCELLEDDTKVVNRQGFSFWLFDRDSYKEAYLTPLCASQKEQRQTL